MSKKLRKTGRKALSVFLSLATTLWLAGAGFLLPVATYAATLSELEAQVAALLAQISALQSQISTLKGEPVAGSCTFTRDLFEGVSGDDVKCLQQYLNSAGHKVASSGAGSPGNETMFYGSLTKAAVASWQAANSVAPAVGYFGPISKAKYSSMAVATPPPPPPPPADGGTPAPTPAGTGLTVSAGTNPVATLAPQKAINVPFTRVKFTASADGDVTVDSITVERTGLMNDAALSGVILLDEKGLRVNQVSKTLSSTHQAVISNDFVVKAGQTREMTIAGDMASSLASYTGQIGYLALVAVNTSATVNGTLPITGTGQTVNNTLTIGTVQLNDGSLDPATSRTKEVGTAGYVFTSLKATAGSAEDVVWKSIAFNQSGSATQDDIKNVEVKDENGNVYPVTVSSAGKYYTADFGDGILLKKGKSNEISIRADINSGSGRSADFDIYRYEDVVFHGQTYGFDIKPSAATTEATTGTDDGDFHDVSPRYDAYEVTISKGSLTVSKSSKIGAENVAAGSDQANLGAFELEAKGESVTFTSWVITVTTSNASGTRSGGTEYKNLTVYNASGAIVGGPQDVKSGKVTITDSITVPAGKNVYTIKADFHEKLLTNDTGYASFTPSSAITSVTGDTTGNSITPSPTSSVQGPTMTVKAGALTVTPAGTFASSTLITNSTNVEVGRLVLDATDSGEDIKITVAQLRKDTNSGNTLARLILRDGINKTDTALNTGTNEVSLANKDAETLTFNLDNAFVVPKGTSKTVGLFADIASTATRNSWYKFDVTAGDWTVKTAKDSTAVTETLTAVNGKGVTLQTAGGYKVAAETTVPVNAEQWLYGGQKGVTLNVLKFTATSEDMAITNLRLQVDVTGTSSRNDYEAVELWDGGTLVQRKVNALDTNGRADFTLQVSGAGSFIIPKDTAKLLTVKADLPSIAIGQAGTAGQFIGIDYDGSDHANKQKARGVESGTTVVASTHSDVTGTGAVVFRGVPQVSLDTSLSGAAVNGTQALLRFKVKALGGDVKLNRLTFLVSTSNITDMVTQLPSFQLWSVTNGNYVTNATGSANSLAGGPAATAGARKNYDTSGRLIVRTIVDNTTNYTAGEYKIAAGAEHTFEFRGSVTDNGTAGGSVSTTLLGEGGEVRPPKVTLTGSSAKLMLSVKNADGEQYCGSPVTNTYAAASASSLKCIWANSPTTAASSTSFIWSDLASEATSAGNTNSVDTRDWMNGFKVPGLPATGHTHTKAY